MESKRTNGNSLDQRYMMVAVKITLYLSEYLTNIFTFKLIDRFAVIIYRLLLKAYVRDITGERV